MLRHTGIVYDQAASRNGLYSRYNSKQLQRREVPLTLIPYYAWSNRQQTAMQVWTPVVKV